MQVGLIDLSGAYDFRLLALSIALALLTPCAAFETAERVRDAGKKARAGWILVTGVVAGLGVSAALDVGISSWAPAAEVRYHYPTLLVTLLLGMICGTAAVFAGARGHTTLPRALIAASLSGATTPVIPYICLLSFRMPGTVEFRWALIRSLGVFAWFALPVLLVIDVKVLPVERRSVIRRLVSSAVLGAAITFLTLGTLSAVRFAPGAVTSASAHTVGRSVAHIVLFAGIVLAALLGTILWTILHRRLSLGQEMFEKARERELFFQGLAEAIPHIVWIADASGKTTYINKHWYEMTGTDPNTEVGQGWMQSIHPDDRDVLLENWKTSLQTGNTFEIEYRLLQADKSYRWYLDRAAPVRNDKGEIQQWFGTCTDIEEQKIYQQTLEQQIKERTEELANANTRLQQEMWEKDLARRTLDEQNEKMVNTLQERSRRATLLAKMGEFLQSCLTREEVFTAALGFAPKIFPTRRGAVALFDSSRNVLEIAGQWHDCELPADHFEAESCWALRTGHPHLVLAGDATARCAHAGDVSKTYLCVPILAQGEALGILHIQATEADPEMGEAEMSFHTTFAAQVGLSVANIRLREALKSQSTKDPLTGLFNRRYLQEMLDREIRRSVRSEQHLGILMIDLDHFKKFNDTFGHEAGDTVLREAASFLVRSVRLEDFVCRYGGEEFVVVLPTADLAAAAARAERIRSKLRELVIMHHGRSLGIITASLGVAALPDHGMTEKELLEAADAALYRAKREGRDRVALADNAAAADGQSSPLSDLSTRAAANSP